MTKEVSSGVTQAMRSLCRSLASRKGVGSAGKDLGAVLDAIPWLDREGKARVRAACLSAYRMAMASKDPSVLCREPLFGTVVKSFNAAQRILWRKTKSMYVGTMIKLRRGIGEPFFLVSWHQKPQEAHEKYQGTVLADRYWRADLAKWPKRLAMAEAYVREHGVITVQQAIGAPDYLITRPNCKHRLIPVRTSEVVEADGDMRSLKAMHPEGFGGMGTRPKTRKRLRKEYSDCRNAALGYAKRMNARR